MKRFTLPDFFHFFISKHLVLESRGESSFRQDFSKDRLKGNVDSNQSSSRGISSLILLFLLFLFSNFLFSQNPSTSLSQGQNGSLSGILDPMHWRNGNLNPQQSHYVEGHSIPYRVLMINMPVGQEVELILGYDVVNGGKYAIDFITDFQQLQSHNFYNHTSEEVVNPLDPAALTIPTSTLPITMPSYLLAANDVIPGVVNARNEFLSLQAADKTKMSIWGATFNGGHGVQYKYYQNNTEISSAQVLDLTNGETKARFSIKFTPTQPNVTLAWGGHIALRQDWGISPILSTG